MQRKTESLAAELQGILADDPVDLARAALVIARLEYPDLNPRPSLDRLRALGDDAAIAVARLDDTSMSARLAAISWQLFKIGRAHV